jgi:general secretion pathway protein E
MRQDPDIIMVGEIRDLATAEMAVQAALTGHLVFTTLHTNDAPSGHHAPDGAGHSALPDQRHRAGRAGAAPGAHAVPGLPLAGQRQLPPFQPVGCVDCRMTGFRGRMGLYELLTVTEAFKDKISHEPRIEALRRQAVADGMRPLRLAGAARVAEGLTTLDEVLASRRRCNG